MNLRACLYLTIVGASLAGCATNVSIVQFHKADSQVLERFPSVAITSETDSLPEIGVVAELGSFTSSFVKVPDDNPRDMALDQVRINAAMLGASAVGEPRCTTNPKPDWSNGCRENGGTCTASAYKQVPDG